MNIKAKLAFSQIKINRMRSFWAVAGIALSNALLVTVCTFVASTLAMLDGEIGGASNQDEVFGAYFSIAIVPAVLITLLIAVMTKIVISNVFKVSAMQKTSEFGILKCVGATKNQIKQIVLYEGVFLSLIGIPIGIILGILLSYAGVSGANLLLNDINALAHIMINEISFYLIYTLSPLGILISSLICFVIVIYSAMKPAKKASSISAIDSIRGTYVVKVKKKKIYLSKVINKVFGFEGELAYKNLKRNSTNFKATLISLTIGVTLFISLGGLYMQADTFLEFIKLPYEQTYIVQYSSARTREINEATGWEESIYAKPIDSSIGLEIGEKLKAYEGVEIFGEGIDNLTYRAILSGQFLTNDMKNLESENLVGVEYVLDASISTLDDNSYKKLCDKLGVEVGSNILINTAGYNDNGHEAWIVPYEETLNEVMLKKADGTIKTFEIGGMLYRNDLPQELDYINVASLRLIVPQAEVRDYTWQLTPIDEEGFKEYADKLLEEYFPTQKSGEYMEEGFSTRVFRTDEYSQVMNIAVYIFLIAISALAVLLMLIGFTNIASTLISNVFMRADEFAVLQSLGMTKEGISKMLMLESFLCTSRALFLGSILGVGITYAINVPIRRMYPVLFEIPLVSILVCVILVLGITMSITKLAVNKFSRGNIIETIRSKRLRRDTF